MLIILFLPKQIKTICETIGGELRKKNILAQLESIELFNTELEKINQDQTDI